jgi:predicted dehydrogenase
MRVAILGHGGQARLHARALKALPDVEFAGFGLWSPSPRDVGVPVPTAEDVIGDRSVDAVVIATPTATHAALACAAFGRG